MEEVFVKKYWTEDKVLFYLHFLNGQAVEQIEITTDDKVFLSLNKPNHGESMLYDQSLDELDLDEKDFITKEEFYKILDDH
jgi:hypothetical protein